MVTLAVGAVESFRTADIHHPTERERERERESLTHSSSILFSFTGSFSFPRIFLPPHIDPSFQLHQEQKRRTFIGAARHAG